MLLKWIDDKQAVFFYRPKKNGFCYEFYRPMKEVKNDEGE